MILRTGAAALGLDLPGDPLQFKAENEIVKIDFRSHSG